MVGTSDGSGWNRTVIDWYREDDGTYTKIRTDFTPSRRIADVDILEEGVSEKEYFKRKLANKL